MSRPDFSRRLLGVAIAHVLVAGTAQAGSIQVDSSLDDTLANLAGNGTCDLREAVAAANTDATVAECGGGTQSSITFAPALLNSTITLADGELAVTDDLYLVGPGSAADSLVIDGDDFSRIFNVTGEATLGISYMTLTRGDENGLSGGAVYSDGTLDFDHCTISDSSAYENGGGLATSADIVLDTCTISGNISIIGTGGGLYAGGGITLDRSTVSGNATLNGNHGGGLAGNPLVIDQSTISGNTAYGSSARGGGVYINSQVNDAFISGTTITGNSADGAGGGIAGRYDLNRGGGGNLTLVNTIVAGNTATSDDDITVAGNAPGLFTLDANNAMLGLAAASLITSGNNNLFTDAPLLEPLADNGGPTLTHRPIPALLGNPDSAVDRGTDAFGLPATDQRGPGFPRVVDGLGLGSAVVDIGAVEYGPPPVGNLTVAKQVDGTPAPGNWTFTLAGDTPGCDISGILPGNPADTGTGDDGQITWTEVPSATDTGTPCTYTVTESAQSGYTLTDRLCTLEGGGGTGVIDPPAGMTGIEVPQDTTTTCTFSNGENPFVEITKNVTGATEGYVPGSEFDLELDCVNDVFDTTFMLADGETFSQELLPPTDCSVAETGVPATATAPAHTVWAWNVIPGSPAIDPAMFTAAAGETVNVEVENVLTRTSVAVFDPAPTGPTCNGNTAALTFRVTVDNAGTEPLTGISVTDDLVATFGTTPFQVLSVSSPDFSVNPLFDGAADTSLLQGTDTLAAGTQGIIDVSVEVTVNAGTAQNSYSNQPVATATGGDSGNAVTDLASAVVTPGDPSDDTPAQFGLNCALPVPGLGWRSGLMLVISLFAVTALFGRRRI